MNNFKPSELPEGTLIASSNGDMFVKDPNGIWFEVMYHCVDDAMAVLDVATPENIMDARGKYVDVQQESSDIYFGDSFEILAFPANLFMSIVRALDDEYEGDTNDQIIRDHIEHLAHEKLRLAEIAEDKL